MRTPPGCPMFSSDSVLQGARPDTTIVGLTAIRGIQVPPRLGHLEQVADLLELRDGLGVQWRGLLQPAVLGVVVTVGREEEREAIVQLDLRLGGRFLDRDSDVRVLQGRGYLLPAVDVVALLAANEHEVVALGALGVGEDAEVQRPVASLQERLRPFVGRRFGDDVLTLLVGQEQGLRGRRRLRQSTGRRASENSQHQHEQQGDTTGGHSSSREIGRTKNKGQ